MITSFFRKSKPINYVLITTSLVLCFLLLQLQKNYTLNFNYEIIKTIVTLLLLVGSLFIINFITKKNLLSKDNSYTFLLFAAFLLFFPKIFSYLSLVIANSCLLLAIRRLITMQSLRKVKEKIFDASLLIFAASLFHFWCILFILLVYISIALNAFRDYKNWLIPFVALFAVAIVFTLTSLIFNEQLIINFFSQIVIAIDNQKLLSLIKNGSLVVYVLISLIAFVTMIFILPKKQLNLQTSYKKIIFSYILGITILLISNDANSSFLIFTFMPVAIMLTNYIEVIEKYWISETILVTTLLTGLISCIVYLL